MARPKKKVVDYFPHDCYPSRFLEILMSKYGNDGYAVFYRLQEVLGKTPNHAIPYGKEIDKEYLASMTGVDVVKLDDILSTLLSIDYLDKDVWNSSDTIWSDEFVESISEVYDNRTTDVPTRYSFLEENPTFQPGNPQSKVKKSKAKKKKVREIKVSSLLPLDEYQKLYPDKDIVNSYNKLKNSPNASHTKAIKWFDGELKMKPPVFRERQGGGFTAYCKKCGDKQFPNDKFKLKNGSSCCHVEYVPDAPKIKTKQKKKASSGDDSRDLKTILNNIKIHE